MIKENRTSKYLLYAIGEIILVVIGILIALQLNTWNEERKRASQEHKIMLALASDFTESKKRLEETIYYQKKSIDHCIALIEMYEKKIPMSSNDTIMGYLAYGAYSWYREEIVSGAYDALINAGNSELIKNEELTKLMAEYFSIAKSTFEDQETSMNHMYNMQKIAEKTLLPLAFPGLKKRIGLDTIRNPNESEAITFLFKQDAFFGHLYQKTTMEDLRYTIQLDLLERIERIQSILSQEINSAND